MLNIKIDRDWIISLFDVDEVTADEMLAHLKFNEESLLSDIDDMLIYELSPLLSPLVEEEEEE